MTIEISVIRDIKIPGWTDLFYTSNSCHLSRDFLILFDCHLPASPRTRLKRATWAHDICRAIEPHGAPQQVLHLAMQADTTVPQLLRALNAENERQSTRIRALEAENTELQQRSAQLEAENARLRALVTETTESMSTCAEARLAKRAKETRAIEQAAALHAARASAAARGEHSKRQPGPLRADVRAAAEAAPLQALTKANTGPKSAQCAPRKRSSRDGAGFDRRISLSRQLVGIQARAAATACQTVSNQAEAGRTHSKRRRTRRTDESTNSVRARGQQRGFTCHQRRSRTMTSS